MMILKTLDDKEIWTFIIIFYRQVLVLANQQNARNCLYTTNIAYKPSGHWASLCLN